MKNSPQKYADMLIEQHGNIKSAIIDVTNTTNALVNTDYLPHNIDFYIEVLTILKK